MEFPAALTTSGCSCLEHTKLTYRFNGRDYRLTDVGGELLTEVLA